MPVSNKLRAYIGFSIRSGKVVYGGDAVLRARGIKALLVAPTINRTTKNQLAKHASVYQIPLVEVSEEVLTECVHRPCKCIGLTDSSLALATLRELTPTGEAE